MIKYSILKYNRVVERLDNLDDAQAIEHFVKKYGHGSRTHSLVREDTTASVFSDDFRRYLNV